MKTVFSYLGWIFLLAVEAYAQEAVPTVKVHYVLNATEATNGSAAVEMTVKNWQAEEITVAIPAWRPGSYRLQHYHKQIKEVSATSSGVEAVVESVDPQTWKVKGIQKNEVTIRYRVTPDRERDHIGKDHYYVEGPATYFYIVGHKDASCTVRFKLPETWKVGSGLTEGGDGTFGACDYDTFADCPTELGPFEHHVFTEEGATFEFVVHTIGKWDSKGAIAMVRKIVREQAKLFGGFPFERYVFIFHFRNSFGGGGLEHLNSTDIWYPHSLVAVDSKRIASIVSHEFFHLWNVKRIRPRELGPFDYTGPVRSKALWLCEGVTSYYGDLSLARARVWSEKVYFQHLATEIEGLQNSPRRKIDSVEAMSQQAWDGKPLDYYNRGEVIGWALDMKVRLLTKGEKSLDDVMRHLYKVYVTEPAQKGKGLIGVGYPEDGILKALNEVSGHDFAEFYRKHISGTEDLPYAELSRAAGLKLELKVEEVAAIGSPMRGVQVERVAAGSDDEKAGLKGGDRVIEVAGKKVDGITLASEMAKQKPEEPIKIKVQRGEKKEVVELTITPVARERTRVRLGRLQEVNDAQQRFVDQWLGRRDY